MSEEVKSPGGDSAEGAPAPDALQNIKAEMNRKLGNVESKLAEMTATLQQQLAALASPKPVEPKPGKPLKDLLYDDPEAYARAVTADAEAAATRIIEERTKKANESQAVLSGLVSEYPELNQTDAELTKLAVEKYKGIGVESPIAYRTAVAEAAAELGLKPKSKRKAAEAANEADSFSLGGGGGGTRAKPSSAQVDRAVESLAAQMGVQLTPQMKENIKKRAR